MHSGRIKGLKNTFILTLFAGASVFTANKGFALDFREALTQLNSHERAVALEHSEEASRQAAIVEGAWGDPMLSVGAQNIPSNTLDLDKDRMSSLAVGISQNIPLTRKYHYQKTARLKQADALSNKVKQQVRQLRQSLWSVAIRQDRLEREKAILEGSRDWISQMLQVSQRLYTNGQISQNALFDVKIRLSELDAKIQAVTFDHQQLMSELAYLTGQSDQALDLTSVPWTVLNQKLEDDLDNAEKYLELKLQATDHRARAQRLNRVPDLRLSLSYMARQAPDAADMFSFGLSLPLPLGKTRKAALLQSLELRTQSEMELEDFRKQKVADLEKLEFQLNKTKEELNILQNRTIDYARDSREIISKSYSHAKANYFELLNAEMRLQEVLSREASLEAKVKSLKLARLFVSGSQLQ